MSPSSSKSKSKDKRAAGKEPLKSSAKPTTGTTGGGVPASSYNPLLGTFHNLETAPVSSAPPVHANGRFRNFDDTDDQSGNIGVEYGCVSNSDSWSGESEDPKDKTTQGPSRQETVDSDKREKIRQKNEKKHQRQKERRAQELHERCCGYLMSRKLEVLAQQLVAMGFPLERATMALITNVGRVEESVAWLFEGGEEDSGNQRNNHSLDSGAGNLKVDISQELAQIAEMEIKFKCSKQEVERAIVACEGDLVQAAENLTKLQKPEETAISQISSTSKVRPKRTQSGAINNTNTQLLKKIQPNSEVEKRWSKTEIRNDLKNLHLGSSVATHPQSVGTRSYEMKRSTPTLGAATSLGLFLGFGSNVGAREDWNAAEAAQLHYTNIDWSLDRVPPPTPPSGNKAFEEKDLFSPRLFL